MVAGIVEAASGRTWPTKGEFLVLMPVAALHRCAWAALVREMNWNAGVLLSAVQARFVEKGLLMIFRNRPADFFL